MPILCLMIALLIGVLPQRGSLDASHSTVAGWIDRLAPFDRNLTVEIYYRTHEIPFRIVDFEVKDIRAEHGVVVIELKRTP